MLNMMLVIWESATSSERDIPGEPSVVNSVGFVLTSNEKIIVISQGFEALLNGKISNVSRTLSIPRRSVLHAVPLGAFSAPGEKDQEKENTSGEQSEPDGETTPTDKTMDKPTELEVTPEPIQSQPQETEKEENNPT